MRIVMAIVVPLVILLPGSPVHAIDKKKLRQAAKMPGLEFSYSIFDFGSVLKSSPGKEASRPSDPEELKKLLKGTSTDAAIYDQLADIYTDLNKEDLARPARLKAIDLYRQGLQANPRDGLLYAKLGTALLSIDLTEAEQLLHKAIQLAPEEPDCWLALAGARIERAWSILAPDPEKQQRKRDLAVIYEAVTKCSHKNLDEVQRLFGDMMKCYDAAVKASPGQARLYIERASARFWLAFVQPFVEMKLAGREQPGDMVKAFFPPEGLADLKEVIRLEPKNHRALGVSAYCELLFSSLEWDRAKYKSAQEFWAHLPKKTRQTIDECLDKLEKLSQSDSPDVAAECAWLLGNLYSLKEDFKRSTAQLRRVVALRPKDENAWDLLMMNLEKNWDLSVILVAHERVKKCDTARAQFILARMYVELGFESRAERILRKAQKVYPDDVHVNLGLATLLILQSAERDTLPKAGRILAKIRESLRDLPRELQNEFQNTYAIYLGLTGEEATARETASNVLRLDSNNETAQKVLSALGS